MISCDYYENQPSNITTNVHTAVLCLGMADASVSVFGGVVDAEGMSILRLHFIRQNTEHVAVFFYVC